MAAIGTHKRRPVAPTKDGQKVDINTITNLRPEQTVEAYHQLFVNIELLMSTMLAYGTEDEVIMMINAARLAQYAREIGDLDKYLGEITASAIRWRAENDRIAKTAETELYSPEATIVRLKGDENPRRLRPPPNGGIITLNVTARMGNSLPPSSSKLLKAEQVYGPFWNIKARCFVVPRGGTSGTAATYFTEYCAQHPKVAARNYRLLVEYKIPQTRYRNCDIYMLVDLPRLVALRDTKILELGLSSREEIQIQDMEERMPIIERAETAVARLPKIVSPESRRYMVHRLVEFMLLNEKRARLRKARYARDGEPKVTSPAAAVINLECIKISAKIGAKIGVHAADIQRALVNKTFSSYVGQFLRMHGREGWAWACELSKEWQKMRKLAHG